MGGITYGVIIHGKRSADRCGEAKPGEDRAAVPALLPRREPQHLRGPAGLQPAHLDVPDTGQRAARHLQFSGVFDRRSQQLLLEQALDVSTAFGGLQRSIRPLCPRHQPRYHLQRCFPLAGDNALCVAFAHERAVGQRGQGPRHRGIRDCLLYRDALRGLYEKRGVRCGAPVLSSPGCSPPRAAYR